MIVTAKTKLYVDGAYVDRGIVPYNCWGFVTNTVSFAPHGGPGGGGCCPCPAHAAHHSTPATLTHLSPGISLCGDGGAPLTVGSQAPKGGVVHVTGNTCSAAPRDALAVFEWTENGKTEAQTNAFTVMSSPIIGDINLNGNYNDDEDILGSLFPGPEGWAMPVSPGTLRPAHLPQFTYLPGDTVLTLESGQGAVRLWDGWSNSLLLLPGQSVTNYTDYQVRVEAVSNGTARLTRTFTGTGAATNLTCSATLTITAGTRLRADTDRNSILGKADDPGTLWSIGRGALIPPYSTTGSGGRPLLSGTNTAPISIDTRGWANGTTFHLVSSNVNLKILDNAGTHLPYGLGNRIQIPADTLVTNLHVSSEHARKCGSAGFDSPDAYDLRLEITPPGGTPIPWGSVRLKVAPLILPPECNPAEKIYSTLNIPAITGLEVIPVPGNYQWTQDMVKFPKTQFNTAGFANEVLDLYYVRAESTPSVNCSDPLSWTISLQAPMLRTFWNLGGIGGNGGNIMATPPLGTNAPYGKIMVGTKHPESKPYWEAQNIQPVISISNDWLVVGHVDELFMPITETKFIYADPWTAADLLHSAVTMIYNGGLNDEPLWCGWTVADKTNTIKNVTVDNGRITRLLTPMDGTATNTVITCGQSVFILNDYLRVGGEILRVTEVHPNGCSVARAQAGRPATVHASNDVIYALSPVLRKNLIDGGVANVPECVASKIQVAIGQLKAGLGDYANSVTFAPVPVLFNNGHPREPTNFLACTSNLANCQPVNRQVGNEYVSVYYPKADETFFTSYFTNAVPKAVAVDVWEHYHCNMGEIHCGTATIRTLSPVPPWWTQPVIQQKWENER